jgi:hypothetical protein
VEFEADWNLVMPSLSARLLPRSFTFARKRRPSTFKPILPLRKLRPASGPADTANNRGIILTVSKALSHQGEAQAAEAAHRGPRQAHVSTHHMTNIATPEHTHDHTLLYNGHKLTIPTATTSSRRVRRPARVNRSKLLPQCERSIDSDKLTLRSLFSH